jgi:hypothetical protein
MKQPVAEITVATLEHLEEIKALADANKQWLGFVNRTGLKEAQAKGWLYVAIGKTYRQSAWVR